MYPRAFSLQPCPAPDVHPLDTLRRHVGSQVTIVCEVVDRIHRFVCTSLDSSLQTVIMSPRCDNDDSRVIFIVHKDSIRLVSEMSQCTSYYTTPGKVLEVCWVRHTLQFRFLPALLNRTLSQKLPEALVEVVVSFLADHKLVIKGPNTKNRKTGMLEPNNYFWNVYTPVARSPKRPAVLSDQKSQTKNAEGKASVMNVKGFLSQLRKLGAFECWRMTKSKQGKRVVQGRSRCQ